MSEDRYADADLTELVQAAFDKYILERLPELLEKHLPLIDQRIIDRVSGTGYTPELNLHFHKRVESIVETTVGNYLRVGGGRDIVDRVVLRYLDTKLESHIEQQVQFRLNRLMERMKKNFEKAMSTGDSNAG